MSRRQTNRTRYDTHVTRAHAGSVTIRKCLCCQQSFSSEGAHNRICAPCKSSDGWQMGNVHDHSTGSRTVDNYKVGVSNA